MADVLYEIPVPNNKNVNQWFPAGQRSKNGKNETLDILFAACFNNACCIHPEYVYYENN